MKKSIMLMMVAAAAMVTVSCGSKKEQAEGAEAGAEQTEQASGDASVATAGENGYMTYDNKKGYTIDIPGGLFKYKNSILEEKDGEEGLLQYTMEKDNSLNNMISVYFKDRDDLTAETAKKEYEDWKTTNKDATFKKDELKDNEWTLWMEEKSEYATSYRAIKYMYYPDKKKCVGIEIEYNDSGKEKFSDDVINHIYESFKLK